MALTVTKNLNDIDAAEGTAGWTFSGISKTATSSNSREGTNCIGGQVANASFGYAWHTHGSSINMTTAGNERVYIWTNCAGAGTYAQSGWMVLIGDGTNRRAYRVGGSDVVPFAAKGWYCLMLDTANLPATYQTVAGASQPTLSAITQFGFGVYNVVAPSGNALNVFCDIVRYGSGLTITSGATDDITFSDIATDDFSSAAGKAYGIIREIQPGVYGIQGDILLGDTSGNSIDFKDQDAIVIFEDRVEGTGTQTDYNFKGQHSATGTFRLELGVAVSSGDSESGRNGVTFYNANPTNQDVNFDFSDTDIEDVFLYGCVLNGMRGDVNFSADATNGISHHVSGTDFINCGQADLGRVVARNCRFIGYTLDADGALLWNENINIKNSQFIGNTDGTNDPAGVEHPSAAGSPYAYDNLTFSGNDYDVNNTSGSAIEVNKNNGSDPSSSKGSAVTFLGAAVTVFVKAVDTDGVEVENARVLLAASDALGPFPFEETVTISNSGTTATVTHSSHGMATGDYVNIDLSASGSEKSHYQNDGTFQITVSDASTYTYTMLSAPGSSPTGTIKATYVALTGLTDVNGEISDSRLYSSDQNVEGWIRLTPTYKTAKLFGTIDDVNGYNSTGVMVND